MLNVVLDPIFIYTLEMGVAGAAIATPISQIVSTLVYLCDIHRKRVCSIFGLTAALFSTQIMTLFTKGDMEMVRVGSIALRANGISFIFFGFYTVYSFLFLVMGKAKEGCILGACRQGICFIPIILFLPSILGLNGILYAQPIADVLTAIITTFMAIHIHKELSIAKNSNNVRV